MKNALKFNQPLVLGNFAADPAGAVKGVIYFNTTSNKFRVYDGSTWNDVAAGTISPVFETDLFRLQDSTDPTKQIAFDATAITSGNTRSIMMPDYNVDLADIATKVNSLDVILRDGSQAMTADLDLGNFKVVNLADPTTNTDAMTKGYADDTYVAATLLGANNGVATLGADGKLTGSQVPAIAITDTFVVATQAAMLALDAQTGDVAVRTDLQETFILQGSDPTVLSNWVQLIFPTVASTDQLPEGATNLYFTDARARAAAVVNSTAGTETDQAASVSAMKTYVTDQISAIDYSAYLKKDGSVVFNNAAIFKARNAANTADANLFQLDSSNVVRLGSSIAANWLPYTDNNVVLGTGTSRYSDVVSRRIAASDGTSVVSLNGYSTTLPSGVSANSAIFGGILGDLGLYTANRATADANPTSNLRFETGNKTAGTGNSGNIYLQTGTSVGGARGSLITDVGAIELGSAGLLTLAPAASIRRATNAAKTSFVEEQYIHLTALSASQTNTVIAALGFAHATYQSCEVVYSVKDSAGNVRVGTLRIVTNGTDVSLTDVSTDTADLGIEFSAVVNGASIDVRYTSGANTATLRADVKRFLV